jgi:hypothetical protein
MLFVFRMHILACWKFRQRPYSFTLTALINLVGIHALVAWVAGGSCDLDWWGSSCMTLRAHQMLHSRAHQMLHLGGAPFKITRVCRRMLHVGCVIVDSNTSAPLTLICGVLSWLTLRVRTRAQLVVFLQNKRRSIQANLFLNILSCGHGRC